VDTPFVDLARKLQCVECGDKGALLTVRYDDPKRRAFGRLVTEY
jgi:hypothetical protein